MSTALLRAYTPGLGSVVGCPPGRNRSCASSRWVLRRSNRSRWASTIAPSAAVMSSAPVSSNAHRYWVKINAASPCDIAAGVGLRQAGEPGRRNAADPRDQQNAEAEADHDRRDALSPNGFHQRFGGVDTDEHQHEQEQHHHRAGVDHHLHHAEEQRLLRDVEAPRARSSWWPGTSPSTPPSARHTTPIAPSNRDACQAPRTAPPRRGGVPARCLPRAQRGTSTVT